MKSQYLKTVFVSTIIFIFSLVSCQGNNQNLAQTYPETFSLQVTNPIDAERQDEPVTVNVDRLTKQHPDFNPQAFVILDGQEELSSQFVRDQGEVVFLADFGPGESTELTVRFNPDGSHSRSYPQRSYAVISKKVGGEWNESERVYKGGQFQDVESVEVPEVHTDHSLYFRFEGPGWESDLIGYRLYLDHRNAVDIFGKKTTDIVLDSVGWDGFESYHEMSDWGMDILKVGDAFGVGTVGLWKNGTPYKLADVGQRSVDILADGPVFSQVRLDYQDWQVSGETHDLTSWYSIVAGSRLTEHTVQVSEGVQQLCAGLVKHGDTDLLQNKDDGGWGYLATYGDQSLDGGKLGMVLFYREETVQQITADELNHFLILEPENQQVSFYFGAAWDKEPGGVTTQEEFSRYLDVTLQRLNNPIMIQDI